MTYEEVMQYLYDQLPMFHRVGAAAYKPSLDNTQALCNWLGHPEQKVKTIHVGGTNGKGSTSHLISASLQASGYKVGLYTSPHLLDFRERIKINGHMIPQQDVIDFVIKYNHSDIKNIQPSFFELTFALAMHYFYQEQVDVAIIEVGMGGRLDSTNVIHPLLSVITNVTLDHQKFLGDDVPAIAREKAGIIKQNTPLVLGGMLPEAQLVMEQKAIEQTAPIFYSHLEIATPACTLQGLYQEENKKTAFCALKVLAKEFPSLNEHNIALGFMQVKQLTGIRGRWEILQEDPLIIADVGHNEAGVKSVLEQVALTPHEQLHIVLGMVNDKDVDKVLTFFPKRAQYYFCKANIPRGMDARLLADKSKNCGLLGKVYESVSAAFSHAKENANENDIILATGSFFTIAEILN